MASWRESRLSSQREKKLNSTNTNSASPMRHGVRACVHFWNRWLFRQTGAQVVSLSEHCVCVCLFLVSLSLLISRGHVPLSLFILFVAVSGRTVDCVCKRQCVCVQVLRRYLSVKAGGKSTSIINGEYTNSCLHHHCFTATVSVSFWHQFLHILHRRKVTLEAQCMFVLFMPP